MITRQLPATRQRFCSILTGMFRAMRGKWKKITALACLCGFAFCYGYLVHRNKLFPYGIIQFVVQRSPWHRVFPEGSWHRAPPRATAGDFEDLDSLPYLAGYQRPSGQNNVTAHVREHAYQGWGFYTSGHAPEALLIDMDGKELYTWTLPPLTGGDAPPLGKSFLYPEWGYWRRAFPFPNGDLLVIYENAGLIKIDKGGNILWSFWGGCHHDLFVNDDGTITVLGKESRSMPSIREGEPVWDELIFVLDPNGREMQRLSLARCLDQSAFAPLLDLAPPGPDLLHNNTVQVLDGSQAHRGAMFGKGNFLISMRNINTIAIIDPVQKRVVWAMTGPWRRQHEPQLLANGNILIYNNRFSKKRSQVLEIDPFSQAIVWSYEDPSFFARLFGAQQRLANGNTLITESTTGRVFEVNREGFTVWEYHNPHRAGKDDELVASLFEMLRLEPGYFDESFTGLFAADPDPDPARSR